MDSNQTLIKLVLLSLVAIVSCNSGVQINDVKYAIDNENILRINIAYESSADSTYIDYWIAKDSIELNTVYASSKDQHTVSLIALLSDTEYKFQINAWQQDNNTWVSSEVFEIKTGILPVGLPEFTLVKDQGDVFDGYIMVRAVHKPGSVVLLDNQANIVWYSMADTLLMNPFSWTQNKSIISLRSTNAIRERDLYGNTIIELDKGEKGLDKMLHHEIRRVNQNNILAITREVKAVDLLSKGGLEKDTVKGDGIILLDSEGNKIWDWNIFQVADPLADPDIMKRKKDWGHANAVNVLSDGNYVVSLLLFNQIWKINAKTGELMWKLGEGGDFDLKEEDIFFKQHAAHETLNGDLLIFDNGSFDRPRSRAIRFNIDDENMTASQTMSNFLPDSLYAFKQGNVSQLINGNLLFDAATINKVIITNEEGEILWQVNSSVSHYRAYYIDDI
jgi:hypothetical protein